MTIYQQIKEKSKIEGKLEVVLASFDDGLEVAGIFKITGLSEHDVVMILKDHKKI
ncbi:MAG: hypothetical protein RIR48_2267 [Bacteroidota bacterium]|jgi:hypothetical protein